MKFHTPVTSRALTGRSLHRERGLKWVAIATISDSVVSLPSQGAWIEIIADTPFLSTSFSRSLHRERGLKFFQLLIGSITIPSLPSQGAWIEIVDYYHPPPTPPCRSLHRERGLKSISLAKAFTI